MTPVASGLFTVDPVPQLLGGRRLSDGKVVFPMPANGDAGQYEMVRLGSRGKLWSYTVQRFRPKSPPYVGPIDFSPFAIGYVELPGEVIVESRLIDVEFEQLRLEMPMELTLFEFALGANGEPITTFAFRPAARNPS